jgi:hypothetical protein
MRTLCLVNEHARFTACFSNSKGQEFLNINDATMKKAFLNLISILPISLFAVYLKFFTDFCGIFLFETDTSQFIGKTGQYEISRHLNKHPDPLIAY